LISGNGSEGARDDAPLERIDLLAQAKSPAHGHVDSRVGGTRASAGKSLHRDLPVAAVERDHSRDGVLELADVPRPVGSAQGVDQLWRLSKSRFCVVPVAARE
jgi:hypothetical protein